MLNLIEFTQNFYLKYEGRISSLALLGGFIFDTLTLQRIDLLYENLVIIFYLILSGGSILLLNYLEERSLQYELQNKKPTNLDEVRGVTGRGAETHFELRWSDEHQETTKKFAKFAGFLPLFIQFAFGGLFSAFFIFYFRSADFLSSWPFILILLGLLIGNEFFRERYKRMVFRVSVYFLAIFSFSIFFLPIFIKSIGASVFLLSGGISLLIVYLFVRLLSYITPIKYSGGKKNLKTSIISLFILINALYFLNLIPPIPLSLKDAGAYYSVQRVENNYEVLAEELPWYRDIFSRNTLYLREGEEAYVFSAVFAPTDLSTNIVHNWEYFDEESGWESSNRITFSIRGGADGGYRGFSKKQNVFPGKWRVNIETEQGQVIGRVRFNIEITDMRPKLEAKML